MGYKIFVSYKYNDDSVYPLQTFMQAFPFFNSTTIVSQYVEKVESYFEHADNRYKGESDNEDLSYLPDDAIWEKLKDRIYDSSVTIVMISPNMRESGNEDEQWIPWEISYSLRETTRGDRTSHSNAVLAIILPDRNHNYNYYIEPFSHQRVDGQWCNGEDPVFSIIRNNMNNKWPYDSSFFSSKGIYPISTNDDSYIPSVTWDEFIKQPVRYVYTAVSRKEQINNYHIYTDIEDNFQRGGFYGF